MTRNADGVVPENRVARFELNGATDDLGGQAEIVVVVGFPGLVG